MSGPTSISGVKPRTHGPLTPNVVRHGYLDERRRYHAAHIVRMLLDSVVRRGDGTVSWVAPVLDVNGWSLQPLRADLYGGLAGIALLFAAYIKEMHSGCATIIPGIEDLSRDVQYTLQLIAKNSVFKKNSSKIGAYIGIGSLIWTLLTLSELNNADGDNLHIACGLASQIDLNISPDTCDVLTGPAGAIPALLALQLKTSNNAYLHMAAQIGDHICNRASFRGNAACWVRANRWPIGLGGFSHGVTGIGWALTKLFRITGESRFKRVAQAAFQFEDALFDKGNQNWLDLRCVASTESVVAWCHGAVGIGLAHIDLDPSLLRHDTRLLLQRATLVTLDKGIGTSHNLCHGDFGAWELLNRVITSGSISIDITREDLLARLLTSVEDHGLVCDPNGNIFNPGLMTGVTGIAYQLLKMHPYSYLPSVLTPGFAGLDAPP